MTGFTEQEVADQFPEGQDLKKTTKNSSLLSQVAGDELWRIYVLLTRAEAAFRDLKSPLAEQPIFHQIEHRGRTLICENFATTSLDPTFIIDPNFVNASDYSFSFSARIGTGPAVVPGPVLGGGLPGRVATCGGLLAW